MLTTLHARKTGDGRLAIVLNDLNVGPELTEQRAHDALSLIKHRAKNMLGLDLLILIAFSQFNACLNRFLSAKCEFI